MSAAAHVCLRCTPILARDSPNVAHQLSDCPQRLGKQNQRWPAASGNMKSPSKDFESCEAFLKQYESASAAEKSKYSKEGLDEAWRRVYVDPKPAPGASGGPQTNAAAALPRQSGPRNASGPNSQNDRDSSSHAFGNSGYHATSSRQSSSKWTLLHVPRPTSNSRSDGGTPGELWDSSAEPVDDDEQQLQGRAGSGGEKIRIVTNYVRVKDLPENVYVYTIQYGKIAKDQASGVSSDDGDKDLNRSQKRLIFNTLSNLSPFQGRTDWATDFDQVWSLKPLYDRAREPADGESHSMGQVTFKKTSGKPQTISDVIYTYSRKLQFRKGTDLNLAVLIDTQQANNKSASLHKTALNALVSDHVIRNSPAISAGSNTFFMPNPAASFSVLQARRGYSTSVRPGTQHVLLNVGISTGSFYQPVTVSTVLDEMKKPEFREYGAKSDERGPKLLKGLTVKIRYNRENHLAGSNYDPNLEANRRRVISSFGLRPSQQKFEHNGQEVSVAWYFEQVLGSGKVADTWPCVNLGVKPKWDGNGRPDPKTLGKQIWIPAQFLQIVPEQRFARRLAAPHMAEISKVALRQPALNQKYMVQEGLAALGLRPNADGLLNLHMPTSANLLSIPARFLDQPVLKYGSSTQTPQNAHWNLKGVKFLSTPRVPTGGYRHAIFTFDFRETLKGGEDLQWIGQSLTRRLRDHGMTSLPQQSAEDDPTRRVPWIPLYSEKSELMDDATLQNKLHKIVYQDAQQHNKSPQMFLVILEKNDSDTYGLVKRVFDQHLGLTSVCLTADKLVDKKGNDKLNTDKSFLQLFSNLALKYNTKLGGQNHAVGHFLNDNLVPAFKHLMPQGTMVVGADVSHAPSQMTDCPSVASVVASMDDKYYQFPGSMRLQASKQEFIGDLHGMLCERLMLYHSVNDGLPKNILFYRDGVGEDMYDAVRSGEIGQIQRAFRDVAKKLGNPLPDGYEVPLTFVVVGKRHNTRFFCEEEDQRVSETNANVKPGLVVDRVITLPPVAGPKMYDFFLQSHQALKGTARPAHYVVLDPGNLSVDNIQLVTYYFCFNFARATTGVSYTSPAYYADRLCERGTLYLKAYTKDRDHPEIPKSDNETFEAYQARVARDISKKSEWNPRFRQADPMSMANRMNPWSPDLDKSMFWI